MFIDASAIVALLTREADAADLLKRLEAARNPITSPIAIFEAVLALCRKRRATVDEARRDVRDFLDLAGITVVPITEDEAATALDAFSRYGKGMGHPAQLNLGDCFAYAVAKNRDVPLLFKGSDFSETDIV
jgi:ribonuclease VapC